MKTNRIAVLAGGLVLATLGTLAQPAWGVGAPLQSNAFLKASGNVLRTDSGAGSAINLRGTNIGGWLTQEDWMSPLGEFAVDRTGWASSAGAGTASRAIDGSGYTVWTTGAHQTSGERITVDLGAATVFNRLSVYNTANPGQYPRRLDIEVSANGSAWKSVATLQGTDGVTTSRFGAQIARYVRLTQTASAAAAWSVGELNLFSDPVLRNATHAAVSSSSSSGTSPAMTLDGDVSSVWQTGVAQAPGQFLTIDLGRNVDMDRVLIYAGAATADDYPLVWDVFTSWDNVSWTKVAS